MTLTEKISYIRGLADGLNLDESKDEVKVIKVMMELLEDIAVSVTDLEELYDEMADVVDEIDEDLSYVEEDLYDDDCDCDDDCCCCDCDDDCDCDCDCDCVYYEVTCPSCEETICVDEDLLLEGEVQCPECGEILEFDFSELMTDDCCCEDDCCCHEADE